MKADKSITISNIKRTTANNAGQPNSAPAPAGLPQPTPDPKSKRPMQETPVLGLPLGGITVPLLNVDELKQKLYYTTLELEAVKAENHEEMKKNMELVKQLLQSLKIVCQESDEAKDELQKLLNKITPLNDPLIRNNQVPLMTPAKANSSTTESNSVSEAHNRSSSPVESPFNPISSPEFLNINDKNGLVNVQKVDQATLVMEGMIKGKALLQKGNLLEAVVEAGPLLQTLLLAGPLPTWRNPPSLKAFHIPSMAAAVDHVTAAQKIDVGDHNKLRSPMMVLKQSQPYAKMACGSSSYMMAGTDGSGDLLRFGEVNFASNAQGGMVAAWPSASYLGTIGKKQRGASNLVGATQTESVGPGFHI
ncbi:uncharacterized protein LOC143561699 [Bidens hawaiensis]|uniref:uncharacterized protein LOC143561699 n=1 Tax=Bidens hawaiensis TaxID=980011 RepID=UPI00404B2400